MDKTQIHQNPLYVRLHRLIKARFVREAYVGNQRQFSVTKKGIRAIHQDGIKQNREFFEFLKETAHGTELLKTLKDLQDTKELDGFLVRFLLSSWIITKLIMIDERLGILANEGQHIDEDLCERVWQTARCAVDAEKKGNDGDLAGHLVGLNLAYGSVVDLARVIYEKFKVDPLIPGEGWRKPPPSQIREADWRCQWITQFGKRYGMQTKGS